MQRVQHLRAKRGMWQGCGAAAAGDGARTVGEVVERHVVQRGEVERVGELLQLRERLVQPAETEAAHT